MLRHSLRGCADWKNEGLAIRSSTSDEAVKLYDCVLTQMCGSYDDQNYGGLTKTLSDMTRADPNFILGQSLLLGLELGGIKQKVSQEVKNRLNELVKVVDKNVDSYEEREVKHVRALQPLARGDVKGAIRLWEEILSQYPTDIHAIRMTHAMYFDNGMQNQMRDSIARVLPHWTGKSLALEGYIHGMYAFGLEETNFYSKAESEANCALHMNEFDGWATHALAHIHDTKGLSEMGLNFLDKTEANWVKSNHLACHNYWHLALHNIQLEQYERAIDIFDEQIIKRATTYGRIGNIVDATSLLCRLDLAQPDSGLVTDQRWQKAYETVKPHLPDDHILGFFDIHCLMASLGSKHMDSVEQIVDKVNAYETNEQWLKTTRAIVNAIIEYNRENYKNCVELLIDVKYDTQCMGASNAQRDVFNQLLALSALKSPIDWHKDLATNLVNEMQTFKQNPTIYGL